MEEKQVIVNKPSFGRVAIPVSIMFLVLIMMALSR